MLLLIASVSVLAGRPAWAGCPTTITNACDAGGSPVCTFAGGIYHCNLAANGTSVMPTATAVWCADRTGSGCSGVDERYCVYGTDASGTDFLCELRETHPDFADLTRINLAATDLAEQYLSFNAEDGVHMLDSPASEHIITAHMYGNGGADVGMIGSGSTNEDYTEHAYGGSGDDTIQLRDSNATDTCDFAYGEGGADTIAGDGGRDEISGGDDDDILDGGDDRDVVRGNDGDDEIRGGADKDELEGNAGEDTLCGDGEDDELQGGVDYDYLYGGGGFDVKNGAEPNPGDTCDLNDTNLFCTTLVADVCPL